MPAQARGRGVPEQQQPESAALSAGTVLEVAKCEGWQRTGCVVG